MAPVKKKALKDYKHYDDLLHLALETMPDFQIGPWLLRCEEFHFGRGVYPKGDQFGWHVHKGLQFELCLSGSFEFAIKGSKAVRLGPGQVFALPPEVMHRWNCKEAGIMLGILLINLPRAETLNNPIEPRLLQGLLKSRIPRTVQQGFMREFEAVPISDCSLKKRLAAWIFLIVEELLRKSVQTANKDELIGTVDVSVSRSQRVASKLMRYIEANISGDLSIDQLEQAVGLSGRQIQRIFIEVTGISCHQYVMERRLENARKRIVGEPGASIKEVAFDCGFSSPAHLSTNFRKAYGVSPSSYLS